MRRAPRRKVSGKASADQSDLVWSDALLAEQPIDSRRQRGLIIGPHRNAVAIKDAALSRPFEREGVHATGKRHPASLDITRLGGRIISIR